MLKRILVTGGTGSFGVAFINRMSKLKTVGEVIVFSRDELKQFEMKEKISSDKIKYVIGDVRDYLRLKESLLNVDTVIHAAAMKQIPASENNPMEAIKTNILGAQNVVTASIECGVKRVIALSTDKAANPANLYGATKLCSDKLMIGGNLGAGANSTMFSVVRYGNVLGSRGSVIPFFLEKKKSGKIPITNLEMTRFWLTIENAVDFVVQSLERMHGGEIFVPKIPSFKVSDVARIVAPEADIEVIGIRPGEKLHEVMITEDDSYNTKEFENYYTILSPELKLSDFYTNNGKQVDHGFRYSSDNNKLWHTLESFKKLLVANNVI
jgi:UDP-N-acetylglucosamine 4,6-dehydratase